MSETKQLLDWIATESDAFTGTINADTLDRPVPGCPDWALRDLAWHLGRVQRFWTKVVRAGVDERPEFDERRPGPSDAGELAEWMRTATRELLEALRSAPWDGVAWTWWNEPRTVGAIGRHQAQETAVHRWDAQSAVGTPEPLPAALAADGVDEFLEIARQLRKPAPIAFEATDTGRTSTLAPGAPAVTVSAPSNDLVLLLYGRVSPDDVGVVGDRAVLDAFLEPIE